MITNFLSILDWNLVTLFSKGIPSICPMATSSKIYVDVSNNMVNTEYAKGLLDNGVRSGHNIRDFVY